MRIALSLSLPLLLLACRADSKPLDTAGADPETVDSDGDGHAADQDCDDDDAAVHPGADELCNGVDDDCDEEVDEGLLSTVYTDADGDGHGDADTEAEVCTPAADQVALGDDCDDGDPGVFPDAEELCDGADNDCDGDVDEDGVSTWYSDADGDGAGDPATAVESCAPEDGDVANGDDCDDTDEAVNPGATELCDGVDNDCDGSADVGAVDAPTWYLDVDGDGHGDPGVSAEACAEPSGYTDRAGDCDDTDFDISPDGTELCDGLDNDCDGDTDEDDAADAATWYADTDADGHGDAASTTRACAEPSGFTTSADDCDDTDAAISPSASELCDGTTDEDCDGSIDEDDAADAATWYADADADGFGAASSGTTAACTQPSGHEAADDDCDDADATVNPDADELCNGVDDDCDGSVDEDSAVDAATWYADTDADGYGDAASPAAACSEPSGHVADDADCDDTDATAYPGSTATETPGDGVDQDCDGLDACTDLDCDGLPDIVLPTHYAGAYTADSYLYFADGGWADADRATLTGSGVYDVQVEDLDSDGYPDIVFANYYDGSSRQIDSMIYWGSASGYSAADRTDLPTLGTVDVLIDDLDEDGYPELVFSSYYDDTSYSTRSYVYWGSSSGYSTAARTDLATGGAWESIAEDFDQDGYRDIAFCNYYSGGYAVDSVVYWGSSAGFSRADRTDLPTLGCRGLTSADLNGDGYEDLVFASYYSGSSHSTTSTVYYGSGSGFSTAYKDDLPVVGALSAVTGDFDGDGLTDLAFGGYYGGNWSASAPTRVFWNSALGLSPSVYTDLGDRGIRNLIAADLDGDGTDDLVGPRYYTGSGHAGDSHIWWGSSAGLSDTDRTDLPTTGTGHAAVGDLDGDGVPEILFSNYYTGTWASFADDTVYWGDGSDPDLYDAADASDLAGTGTWGSAALVGNTDW